MEPGLTAGRQAGWEADEIQAKSEILKLAVDQNILFSTLLNQCYSKFNAFPMLFQANTIGRLFYKV